MQRQNNILRKHKNGFAIIMAISVIVILGTIMALSLSLTSQTTKRTSQVYLYEQASLLAVSAAEYSLFMIAKDGPCSHVNDLNFLHNGIFNISINNRYIYSLNADGSMVCTNSESIANNTGYTYDATPDTNGTILMDIVVEVNDQAITAEPIRYFRRTVQKL